MVCGVHPYDCGLGVVEWVDADDVDLDKSSAQRSEARGRRPSKRRA